MKDFSQGKLNKIGLVARPRLSYTTPGPKCPSIYGAQKTLSFIYQLHPYIASKWCQLFCIVYNSGPIAKGKISCAAGISISFEREDTLCV